MGYLGGKKYDTTLDLKDSFFHIDMEPGSVPYTSFVVHHGQFDYTQMPFGLKNAPVVFARFVYEIFADLVANSKISIYMWTTLY